jgi:C1A family cysteine protease
MIYAAVTLAILLASANAKLFSEDHKIQKAMWHRFKEDFGITVSADEDEMRFGHFLSNLRLADERQAKEKALGGTATHGITKFMHLSRDEFRVLLGSKKPAGHVSKFEKASRPVKKSVSGEVDWAGVLTTPVKDQGRCGSCWAFSATEQVESDTMRTLGTTYELAPEQVVQCADQAYGCRGGWTEVAYEYIKKVGGIEQEADYPYTSGKHGVTGRCDSVEPSKFVVDVTKFYSIDEGYGNGAVEETEDAMGDYMESTGPLSICVDADNWNTYTGGVMAECGHNVDHCVQAVGIDRSASKPYWKVRNSWGTSWGEGGYIRLLYGKDTCSIASDATYAAVKLD